MNPQTICALLVCLVQLPAVAQDLEWARELREHGERLCERAFDAAEPNNLRKEALDSFREARGLLQDASESSPAQAEEIEAELANVNALIFWTSKLLVPDFEPETAAEIDPEKHFERARRYEEVHPDDTMVVLARYFEVAERHLETRWGLEAQKRILVIQKRLLAEIADGGPAEDEGGGDEDPEGLDLPDVTFDRVPFVTNVWARDRPTQSDELHMLGDKGIYTGTVLLEEFDFRTDHGRLEVPTERIAALFFGNRIDRDTAILVSVNGDCFRGILRNSHFRIELATGDEVRVSSRDVWKVYFRRKPNELARIPSRQQVKTHDGCRFSARVALEPFSLSTDLGRVTIDPANCKWLWNPSASRNRWQVGLHDGSTLSGEARLGKFRAELDIGATLTIEPQDLFSMWFGDGTLVWKPMHSKVITLTENRLGYDSIEGPNGVEFTEISKGTAVSRAGLKVGDLVLSIDGKHITSSDQLVAARNAVWARKVKNVELMVYQSGVVHIFVLQR